MCLLTIGSPAPTPLRPAHAATGTRDIKRLVNKRIQSVFVGGGRGVSGKGEKQNCDIKNHLIFVTNIEFVKMESGYLNIH